MKSSLQKTSRINMYGAQEIKGYIPRNTKIGFVISLFSFVLIGVGAFITKQKPGCGPIPNIGITIPFESVNLNLSENKQSNHSRKSGKSSNSHSTSGEGKYNGVDKIHDDIIRAGFGGIDYTTTGLGEEPGTNGPSINSIIGEMKKMTQNPITTIDPPFKQGIVSNVTIDYNELQKYVEYPPIALKTRFEGVVEVQVFIGDDGKPLSPQIISSPSPLLSNAAIKAIMSYGGYKPALQNNTPVGIYIKIPIHFKIR